MSIPKEHLLELHPQGHLALERLVATTRDELDRARSAEYRAASLHALLSSYSHRYLNEATADLRFAVDALTLAGRIREGAVSEVAPYLKCSATASLRELAEASPEPYGSELTKLRAELIMTSQRVSELEAKNVETLGGQMALVNEVLAGLDHETSLVYGRELPSSPRMLRGVW